MRRRLIVLTALWLSALVSACARATPALPPVLEQPIVPSSPVPTAEAYTPTAASTATLSAAKPATVKPSTAAKPTATMTRAATAAPKTSPAALKLLVTSPVDESVVNVASITVTGQTIPGAVVSVNGDLIDVDATGKFRIPVNLEEGPNVMEIVASDDRGSELSTVVRIIYEP